MNDNIKQMTDNFDEKYVTYIDTKFILWLDELKKVTKEQTKGGEFKINTDAAKEFYDDGFTPYQCFREAYDCDGD